MVLETFVYALYTFSSTKIKAHISVVEMNVSVQLIMLVCHCLACFVEKISNILKEGCHLFDTKRFS